MTAHELRAALATTGLSLARLGRILSTDRVTPYRWAAGRRAVPVCVALLLALVVAGKVTIDDLESAAGIGES